MSLTGFVLLLLNDLYGRIVGGWSDVIVSVLEIKP